MRTWYVVQKVCYFVVVVQSISFTHFSHDTEGALGSRRWANHASKNLILADRVDQKRFKRGRELHHLATIAVRWQEQITWLHIALNGAGTKVSEDQSYLKRGEEEEWGGVTLFFIIHYSFRTLISPRVERNPNNPSVRLPRSEPLCQWFRSGDQTEKSKDSRHKRNEWGMPSTPPILEQGI